MACSVLGFLFVCFGVGCGGGFGWVVSWRGFLCGLGFFVWLVDLLLGLCVFFKLMFT